MAQLDVYRWALLYIYGGLTPLEREKRIKIINLISKVKSYY